MLVNWQEAAAVLDEDSYEIYRTITDEAVDALREFSFKLDDVLDVLYERLERIRDHLYTMEETEDKIHFEIDPYTHEKLKSTGSLISAITEFRSQTLRLLDCLE